MPTSSSKNTCWQTAPFSSRLHLMYAPIHKHTKCLQYTKTYPPVVVRQPLPARILLANIKIHKKHNKTLLLLFCSLSYFGIQYSQFTCNFPQQNLRRRVQRERKISRMYKQYRSDAQNRIKKVLYMNEQRYKQPTPRKC